jgi:Spy/CpxP family protein refolding chaperone
MNGKGRIGARGPAAWIAAASLAVLAGSAVAAEPQPAQGKAAWDCPYGAGPGYGMGPGMMWGPGGGGPGMMGGGGMMGWHGMGRGMMGPGMMGPGMGPMGGYWAGGLDLSDEQRTKINAIHDEVRKQHWSLMGEMMDERAKVRDLYDAAKPDYEAIEKSYKRIGELRQKMLESSFDAHKRMDALLTDEQRQQRRQLWRRGWSDE